MKKILPFLAYIGLLALDESWQFIKRFSRSILNFLKPANLWQNKSKVAAGITVIVAAGYVLASYTVVFIAKDEKKQTAVERMFLKSSAMAAKQLGQINVQPNDDLQSKQKRINLRGKVKDLGTEQLIIVTRDNREQPVILDAATRIAPPNKQLANDMEVAVFAVKDGDNLVADRISIIPSPVKRPASDIPID